MSNTFISKIHINEVRHIHNFEIPISETERKHLIITGKNGSGKTSMCEEIYNSKNAKNIELFYGNKVKFLKNSDEFLFMYFPAQRLGQFQEYNSSFRRYPFLFKRDYDRK